MAFEKMSTPSNNSAASQFSIKRLFWTLIVASVVFKIADVTGLLAAFNGNWEFARGSGKVIIVVSLIAFSLITLIYIGWLGIRFPHLVDQYIAIRKRRQKRREEFIEEFEASKRSL